MCVIISYSGFTTMSWTKDSADSLNVSGTGLSRLSW